MPHFYPEKQIEYRMTLDKFAQGVYTPLCELDVTAWWSKEPLPFAKRRTGKKMTLNVGDEWGGLFDCAWFNFKGKVPVAGEGQDVVALIDISGEGLVVGPKGEPVQGLTSKNAEWGTHLKGKQVVLIDPSARKGLSVDLWVDGACNDLFGRVTGGGKVTHAKLAIRNKDLLQLYYDYEVLLDLSESLPKESARRHQILKALSDVTNMLTDGKPEEARAARARLAPELTKKGGDPTLTVSAVGHAHLDLAWLWPQRETLRKAARTYSTVMTMMDRYPDYVFGASQPQCLKWMKDHYPSLYKKIRQRVKEGRFEIQGGMWVESDINVPSGESLVRQFLLGRRFFRDEFGITVKNHWMPDVFGYSGAMPQIMKKCGIDYFMTQKLSWSRFNKHPHHSFKWEGIDGSQVLAHMLPEDDYNSPVLPGVIKKTEDNYLDKGISDKCLCLFGIGDGGGGPGEEHLERLERIKNLNGIAQVKQQRASDFFEEWKTDADEFETYIGELYLEFHQGTLTTQARNKRYNRKMELGLRELEFMGVLPPVIATADYPSEDLQRMWEEVLYLQFHDILPGSSITRVYDESLASYAKMTKEVQKLTVARDRALTDAIDTTAAKRPVVLVNSLGWDRTEWVSLGGKWQQVSVPSMGYTVADAAVAAEAIPTVKAGARTLENELLKVKFNADGSIASVYDKANDREAIEQGEAANRLTVYDDKGDAWDFQADYQKTMITYFELTGSEAVADGPTAMMKQTYRYGESTLTQTISLTAGSRRIDFETHVDWKESGKMLRTLFPLAVRTMDATCEIQFGHLKRPTHSNTKWDWAKYEVAVQKWIDLSQPDYGVALLNDCKYGHSARGNVLGLSLLRAPHWPDPKADRAEHDFTYALMPHAGNHLDGGVVQAGYELNVPLRQVKAKRHEGALAAEASFLAVDAENIIIETVKKAEDTGDMIVRLYEAYGMNGRTTLELGFDAKAIAEVNMVEEGPVKLQGAGKAIDLAFTPFEVKTLRISPAAKRASRRKAK